MPVIGLPHGCRRATPRSSTASWCTASISTTRTRGGVIHATASIWPTVMATAYMRGASGADLLTAYVAGVEAATRLAAVGSGPFHQIGFHPTGLIGVFGCTLAAGTLMGLSPQALVRRRASRCPWPRAAWSSWRTAPGPSACIRAGRRSPASPRRRWRGRASSARRAPTRAASACSTPTCRPASRPSAGAAPPPAWARCGRRWPWR